MTLVLSNILRLISYKQNTIVEAKYTTYARQVIIAKQGIVIILWGKFSI